MFGDSSQIASAMIGIAVISQLSEETSGIVASWARIAKWGVTMPRLELIANHMNVNMGYNIYNAFLETVRWNPCSKDKREGPRNESEMAVLPN